MHLYRVLLIAKKTLWSKLKILVPACSQLKFSSKVYFSCLVYIIKFNAQNTFFWGNLNFSSVLLYKHHTCFNDTLSDEAAVSSSASKSDGWTTAFRSLFDVRFFSRSSLVSVIADNWNKKLFFILGNMLAPDL